jgi:hypothetical protein
VGEDDAEARRRDQREEGRVLSGASESLFPRQPRKPWPKSRLRRFIKLARLNYRVGGGLGPSVRVAWKDSRRAA